MVIKPKKITNPTKKRRFPGENRFVHYGQKTPTPTARKITKTGLERLKKEIENIKKRKDIDPKQKKLFLDILKKQTERKEKDLKKM